MNKITHRIKANGLTHAVRDTGNETDPVAMLLHGFPDSSDLWGAVTPLLVDAGFRVIAPDMRGFGDTDIAATHLAYDINNDVMPDMLGILSCLGINNAHIVGHDFGAPVAWTLAAHHPDIFKSLTSLSVGHMRAYLAAGAPQYARSWYILVHQLRGICEFLYRSNDWALFKNHWSKHGDAGRAVEKLSRPGRLTAGLDWYRTNISIGRMFRPPPPGTFGEEIVRIPTLGIWSDGEKYLTEKQMILSEKYVQAPWRYHRINGASHWIPYEKPDELAREMIAHWRAA